MAVDNKTEDTAYLTKTVEMPDGSFRPNIIHADHTNAVVPFNTASSVTNLPIMNAAQITVADLKVGEKEAAARAAHGKEAGGTTTSGGSIKKGK